VGNLCIIYFQGVSVLILKYFGRKVWRTNIGVFLIETLLISGKKLNHKIFPLAARSFWLYFGHGSRDVVFIR
jgi:hypothetical protein